MPIIATRASAAYGAGFAAITTPPFLGPFGAYEPIAVTTVPSGGVASVSFGSIPQTYTHLQVRWFARGSSLTGVVWKFNNDSAANYARHRLTADGATDAASEITSASNIYAVASWGIPNGASKFGSGVYDILDYSNTNKYKTLRGLAGQDSDGSGGVEFLSGLWMNAAAITSIFIEPNTGTIAEYSSFALYGIKGN
jgi:hypothetical protein